MKTKRPAAAANQLICRYGSARFYAPQRAKSEWKDPNVPEFKANWVVRFHVGGRTWEESAGPCYPVADGLRAVKVWAETRMATELEAARAGKLEAMQAVVRPARAVMLDEVGRVYLSNVPPNKPDYRKNWQRLEAIATEGTGLDAAQVPVTDAVFSRAMVLGWVRMRQEHFRRGWTERGAAPGDAWPQLREALKAGKLPGIDKQAVMECNTTIKTYLRCAKAVFANQREYLVGLDLPPLRDFLGLTVDLAAPEGHREIDPEVMARLQADLPRLALEDPRVHAFCLILAWTSARPVTITRLRGDALRVLPDGTGVIDLPATKGGAATRMPVSAEVVHALERVRTVESLIGARHATEATDIHDAHNAWLTSHGLTGTQKSYVFRHMRLQQYRALGGAELAAAVGGHTSTAMVERKYTQNATVIPMVDPFAQKTA